MSNAAKLRKKAAEFEQLKQFDRAIAMYARAVEEGETEGEDVDVTVLNKVGDLTLRQGRVADAVTYYERAIEHYATVGLFNNAIALCNKVLRSAPGRSNVYFTLGRICARKGLRGDATRNFLEYATRMQQDGRVDEGMRALAEVADLMPELTEVRRLVDEHAARAGITLPRRKTPASSAAQPDAASRAGLNDKSADLVFLDVEYEARTRLTPPIVPRHPTPPAVAATASAPNAAKASFDDILLFDPSTADPIEFDDLDDDAGADDSLFGNPAISMPVDPSPAASTTFIEEPPRSVPSDAPIELVDDSPAGLVPLLDGLVTSSDYDEVEVAPLDGLTVDASVPPDSVEIESTLDVTLLDGDEEAVEEADADAEAESASSMADDVAVEEQVSSPELLVPGIVVEDFRHTADNAAVISLISPLADEIEPTALPMEPAGDEVAPVLEFEPVPEIDEAIAAGSLTADDDTAIAVEAIVVRPPFRLDPHDFILPGELPPLVLDDAMVEEGMAATQRVDRPTYATPSLPIASVAAEANAVAHTRRDALREAVGVTPHDWVLRRRLAEALFEAGERDAALAELETALAGFFDNGDVVTAAELADELVRVAGDRVPYHQKRVELAVRLQDQQRLRVAYLDLADSLVHHGDESRARAVYARVLEIDPYDDRARSALGAAAPPLPEAPAARPDDQFVDLADWLRDDDEPASTRMRMREPTVSGDEQADFDALLRHFKEGVSRSLGEEDYESHYDLGVAYKEMGLLDDAIAEFQKALRSRSHRLPAYEALGQCFVEQERYQVAATVLSRALHEPGLSDEQRVGVLYLLAYSSEALQRWTEAKSYYQRVYATDINFRDVAARLLTLDQAAS